MANEKSKFFSFRDLHSIQQHSTNPSPSQNTLKGTSNTQNNNPPTLINTDFEQHISSVNKDC